MTEPRRFRLPWWWAVLAIALAEFLRSVITVPQRSFFPVYAQADLLYSAFLISLLASLRQVLGMIGAPLGGILSDRIGPRWAFLLGMSELAVGSLAFITRWPPLVIACWAFAGLAAGEISVGSQGYLIEASRPAFLGAISGFYNIGMTLGGAVGNAISGPLVDAGGFGRYGAIALVASLAATVLSVLLLPKVGQHAARASHGAWADYRLLLRRREVLNLTFFRFLPTCYWGVALVFIPLRLYNATGSASAVAWYGTVSLVLASMSQWLTGFLADRVGRKWPTLALMSGIVLAGLGLGLAGERVWAIFVFGAIGAASAWSLSVLMPCLVADTIASEERGKVLGWLHFVWNGGMLVGSLIGGALFAWFAGAPFLVAAALNVAGVAIALAFFKQRNRQDLQDQTG